MSELCRTVALVFRHPTCILREFWCINRIFVKILSKFSEQKPLKITDHPRKRSQDLRMLMPECCSLSSLPATFFWRFLQFFSIFSRFFPRFLAKIRLRWCLLIYNRKNHKRRSKKWTLRETVGPLNCLERGIVMRMVRGHGRLHAGDCGKERG